MAAKKKTRKRLTGKDKAVILSPKALKVITFLERLADEFGK